MKGGLQEVPWVRAQGGKSGHLGRRRGPVGSGGRDPSPQSVRCPEERGQRAAR